MSNHKNFETRYGYEDRVDNLSVTHGSAGIALSIAPGQGYIDVTSTHLTIKQARELAQTLLRFAAAVEAEADERVRAALMKAASEQDLASLPSGKHYLDREDDLWYKTPEGLWFYDPEREVEDGTWGVGGDTEDDVRRFGPVRAEA